MPYTSYEAYYESLSADDKALADYEKMLTTLTDEQLSAPGVLTNVATYRHGALLVIEQTKRGIRPNHFTHIDSSTGTAIITSKPGAAGLMSNDEVIEYNKKANPELAAKAEARAEAQENQDLEPVVSDQSRPGESATIGTK